MKKLFKIILGATVGSTLLLSSCNFLDVDPYFEATFKEDSIFTARKMLKVISGTLRKVFPTQGLSGEIPGIRGNLLRTK